MGMRVATFGEDGSIIFNNDPEPSLPEPVAPTVLPDVLPNGIKRNGRGVIGVDWSEKKVDVYEEGKEPKEYASLVEMAPHYTGYLMGIESTANSYKTQDRKTAVDALKANDIEPWCYRPKYTADKRIENGVKKSNTGDAKTIYEVFTTSSMTCHRFKPFLWWGKRGNPMREKVNTVIRDDRYQAGGDLALEIAKKYIRYEDVSQENLRFVYTASVLKVKRPTKAREPKKSIGRLLMAAEECRAQGRGWEEFRRMAGNYGQSYPSMLRSEFYYHIVQPVIESELTAAGVKLDKEASEHTDAKTGETWSSHKWNTDASKIKKEVFKSASRMLKWLWRLTDPKAQTFLETQATSPRRVIAGN